ncbi:MAG: MBL fold metallo-hydrolase [Bacteroidetes bacterium]|nr:MBL fold metallo-hydrolase [Bacteroidota bacterium]
MKVTFLGTGTSQGVPVISCPCKICTSSNPRDNRLRSAILIEDEGTNIVIDTGPDFRQQMLRAQVKHLDAIVFTHEHKDHLAGLDDIRAFNYFNKKRVDVYAHERVQAAIKREFPYIFDGNNYPGIPEIDLYDIRAGVNIQINNITLQPLEVMHYQLPVFGFRINNFVYITDANFIAPHVMREIKGVDHFVINALRREKHISHFTLDEALAVIEEVNPGRAYLTHISHQLGLHDDVAAELPKNVVPAYDGMIIEM